MKRFQSFLEFHAFGVCTKVGEKLGVAASAIRLFFIYASFLTFGSPIIIYLVLAWIIDFRRHLRMKKSRLTDF